MGYDICIGERPAETGESPISVELDTAPSFPADAAGHSNLRRPSYGAWDRFCGDTGLRELIFDKSTGLMREHPGTVRLTRAHLAAIRRALGAYRDAHPRATPTFESGDERDHHLARLTWLEWWVDWALANCKRPVINNR